MAKGVLGGLQPDPDKGKAFRHTRAKGRLMLGTLTTTQQRVALELLIEQVPEKALDALIKASGEN